MSGAYVGPVALAVIIACLVIIAARMWRRRHPKRSDRW